MPKVFDRNDELIRRRKTMTAIRIYGLIWFLVLGLTGISYSMGLINDITLPIFGFVYSTLAVMGFVAVLPIWVNEYHAPKTYSAARLARISKRQQVANARSVRNTQRGSSDLS